MTANVQQLESIFQADYMMGCKRCLLLILHVNKVDAAVFVIKKNHQQQHVFLWTILKEIKKIKVKLL